MNEMRALLDELKVPAEKRERIMELTERLFGGGAVAFSPNFSRHVSVDRVEAYGLDIEVDAHGRATRVGLLADAGMARHSDGFDVERAA